jgi:hypothetical protein
MNAERLPVLRDVLCEFEELILDLRTLLFYENTRSRIELSCSLYNDLYLRCWGALSRPSSAALRRLPRKLFISGRADITVSISFYFKVPTPSSNFKLLSGSTPWRL